MDLFSSQVRPQDRLTLDACLGHAWISMMGGSLSKIAKLLGAHWRKWGAKTDELTPKINQKSSEILRGFGGLPHFCEFIAMSVGKIMISIYQP